MFAEERQEKIMRTLEEDGSVKVNKLSEYFNVSEATIRRDLQEMEDKKFLKRTHGGAVKFAITNYEPTFSDKTNKKSEEKTAIGKFAASLINDGDTIILDSGTTTLEIAKHISNENLTVITNSIDIAAELINKDGIELIITGGMIRSSTRAMVGHISEATYKNFKVDKAFIGANGISINAGITTPNFVEAQTKKAMLNCANKLIVVADSSKFDNVCFSVICPIEDVTAIVTNEGLTEDVSIDYKKLGIEILLAK